MNNGKDFNHLMMLNIDFTTRSFDFLYAGSCYEKLVTEREDDDEEEEDRVLVPLWKSCSRLSSKLLGELYSYSL